MRAAVYGGEHSKQMEAKGGGGKSGDSIGGCESHEGRPERCTCMRFEPLCPWECARASALREKEVEPPPCSFRLASFRLVRGHVNKLVGTGEPEKAGGQLLGEVRATRKLRAGAVEQALAAF